MPDDIVPLMPGSAEEELDFQKRFTWDEPGGERADAASGREVALDHAPKLRVAGERSAEETVVCKATWDGLAAGGRGKPTPGPTGTVPLVSPRVIRGGNLPRERERTEG